MIICKRYQLEQRAYQRGYTLAEVMPCVVHQDGETWTVDEVSPSYPHPRGPKPPECLAGTELKKLLGRVGITAAPDCSCNSRAYHMDQMGCQWTRDNVETVVDWLGEEASKRGMPFFRPAGRALVALSLRLAERKAHVLPAPE